MGNIGNPIQNSQIPKQFPSQDHQILPTPEPSQEPLQEPIGITRNLIQNSHILGKDLSQSSKFPSEFFSQALNQDSSPVYIQDLTPNCTQDPTPNCARELEEDSNDKKNKPFSQKLIDIKLYHTDDLQWGELY